MVSQAPRLIPKHTVVWSMLVVVFALIASLLPNVSSILVYDRAAILTGELWRLITGHWVHFSASHMFYDVTVLIITGLVILSLGYRYLIALCLIASLLISLVMLVLLPSMAFYGGLSGVAIASTVYMALMMIHEPPPWRWIGLSIFLLCMGKLFFDAFLGQFALIDFEDDLVLPVYLSHFVGAVCGLVIYLWASKMRYHLFNITCQKFNKSWV